MVEPRTSPSDRIIRNYPLRSNPRLRVHHFLIWMFCTSAYAACLRSANDHTQPLSAYNSNLWFWSQASGTVFSGALFCCLLIQLFECLKTGLQVFFEPGHWFCLIVILITFTESPAILLALTLNSNVQEAHHVFVATGSILWLLSAGICALIIRQHFGNSWTTAAIILAIFSVFQSILLFALWFGPFEHGYAPIVYPILESQNWGYAIVAIALLQAMCIDLWLYKKRDWLHWTSLICCLMLLMHWTLSKSRL